MIWPASIIHTEKLIAGALAVVGFGVAVHAVTSLDLGDGFAPGAGTLPFIGGQILACLGLWSAVAATPVREKAEDEISLSRMLAPLVWVTFSVLAFAAVLRSAGLAIAILCCLLCLRRILPGFGHKRLMGLWFAATGGSWILFSAVLGRPVMFLPAFFSELMLAL